MPKVKHSVRDISEKTQKGYRRKTGRTTLRGAKKEADALAAPEPSSIEDGAPDKSVAEPIEDEEETPQVDAYNALLTLLKPENDKPTNGKNKKAKASDPQAEGDHIEGLDDNQETEYVEDEDNITDDDNEGDDKDPFETHFASIDSSRVSELASLPSKPRKYESKVLGKKSILREPSEKFTSEPVVNSLDSLKLKYRLIAPFTNENPELSDLQLALAAPMFSYRDMLYSGRKYENEEEIQNMYTLHLMNHIYKTRDRVLKNNGKVNPDSDAEYRDQGFTRPKVLVLLPTRNSAWKFISRLNKISGLSQVENRKRFKDAFYDESTPPPTKPEDFQQFFSGNTDDMFCLGVKFTRQATKLYSSFYNSDLIVASPLGLKMIIGFENDKKKKRDYDFLSSIEILLMDQAEGMYMQTWDNVEHIMKYMNLIPKESHGCDFSRVRNWYLEENAKHLRQTIIISEYSTPEMNNCFSKHCHNIGGFLKCRPYCNPGSMAEIGLKIRQSFHRIEPPEPRNDPNVRFKHFTSVTLPSLFRSSSETGTLIFVPSYMDFVRLRNYMDKENISCAAVSEYTSNSNVSRARSYFATNRTKMLMITERFHHFRRFQIKGVQQVIFYGLPENPQFYKEIVRFLARTSIEMGVDLDVLKARIIYSKWDSSKVERIVGSDRIGVLFEGIGETYQFN